MSFGKNLKIKSHIISGTLSNPEIRINLNNVNPLTNQAKIALDKLKSILNSKDIFQKIFLEPGDMLIINNRNVVHGRTSFEANFDGHDRWLQRVYVTTSLWNKRSLITTDVNCRIFSILNKQP